MKTFRVAPERVVVMPKSIMSGPGITALRFKAGDLISMSDVQAANRYVRNRVRIGDLIPVPAKE